MIVLHLEPLTTAAFAPFGEVVECEGAQHYPINQGFAERFDDLARVDTLRQGGETNVSLCTAEPRPLPIAIAMMERHPLGSQLFFPLEARGWLVVVGGDGMRPANLQAFRAGGHQGVNYRRNVWHHPLLVLDRGSRFLIVDRKGPGDNLEEISLASEEIIVEVGRGIGN
ncbi:MAG: ureidoglycolate lyase [Pseudomonadota bacterium]|nr:ureidoglycolate lyase [Pseudomonadota bacterium]